jgi:hypothetical protein
MLFAQMMNAFPVDSKSVATPSSRTGAAPASASASASAPGGNKPLLPDPKQSITALTDAYHYFRKVDDHVGMAKALCRIVETYLHVAMITVGVLGRDRRELNEWLRVGEFDVSSERSAFSKFLKKMQDPAAHAMELCVSSLRVRLLLKWYAHSAESWGATCRSHFVMIDE